MYIVIVTGHNRINHLMAMSYLVVRRLKLSDYVQNLSIRKVYRVLVVDKEV